MTEEQYIPNSGLSVFTFYVEKVGLCLTCFIVCMFSYLDGRHGTLWHAFVPMGVVLFLWADSIVMPTGRTGKSVTFHHLWRISRLDVDTIRFLWISEGGYYKMQRKGGHKLMVCLGRYPWNFYMATCDNINGVADQLKPYRTL